VREGRVERALALVHAGGGEPTFVLTKADVGKHRERTARLLDALAPGVPRLETSIATGEGLDDLTALVADKGTAALVGASGAGKSSLVNTMFGHEVQNVAEVRGADRKGRHTTTGRQLFPLPGGGVIIDTPGLRALGLWDNKGVEEAFPDIERLSARCRFRDCAHRGEPGCAVADAVAKGELDSLRLSRFLALHDELIALDRRRQERGWALADRSRPNTPRRHRPSPD
jgi:ribosome biogenesis GTPase